MRRIVAGLAVISLTACGSVYDEPAPAASAREETSRISKDLPTEQVRLLEYWQKRNPGTGELTLGQALRAEQQTLIAEYKARGDSAEVICVLIKSGSPRVNRKPIEILPDPFDPAADLPTASSPCDAMTHYQAILTKLRDIEIRLD